MRPGHRCHPQPSFGRRQFRLITTAQKGCVHQLRLRSSEILYLLLPDTCGSRAIHPRLQLLRDLCRERRDPENHAHYLAWCLGVLLCLRVTDPCKMGCCPTPRLYHLLIFAVVLRVRFVATPHTRSRSVRRYSPEAPSCGELTSCSSARCTI